MRFSRKLIVMTLTAVVLATAGCQSAQKKSDDPRSDAARQWDAARSSVMFGLAQDQYRNGSFDRARQTVDEALKLTPESAPLHLLSARLYVEKGLLESAERELDVTRVYALDDPESNYLSGVIYQRWQRLETALDYYQAAAKKAPAELAYLMAEAETYVALGRNDEAMALLTPKVEYFENSGVIRDAVGQLLEQAGRYEEAVAMFRQASLLSPDDLAIRERLGMAFYYQKQYRDAAETLGEIIQKDGYSKRFDLFAILGQCQLHVGQPRLARDSYERATDLAPGSADAWRGLGQAALEIGDLGRAELALLRSQRLDNDSTETHLLLGYVYLKLGRCPEALTQLANATALDPRDTLSLCLQGCVQQKLGRREAAMQCYAEALKINPRDDMASQLMASIDLHDEGK